MTNNLLTVSRLIEVVDWLYDNATDCAREHCGYFIDAADAIEELLKRRVGMEVEEG